MTEGAGSHTATAGGSNTNSMLRTFLIADVRGYTRFSAERGDAAAAQLSEHFLALCREVITAQRGDFFGSAGDQALAAFASAHAALRAALALQARLKVEQAAHPDLPLLAGIGLDTGEAIQVGDDYRGNAINLAARLCAIAGPGDIFASDTVLAVARVVEGLAAVDRGEVQLKGLSNPVRVVQIARDGELPAKLPPLQPILVLPPTNLPDAPTPFIGREQEVRAIRSRLSDPAVRLLTLTGPGGTGKTRLALQVGTTVLPGTRDGVFFCDLSPLSDPDLVCSSVASVLRVKEEPGTSLETTLIEHLRSKQMVLVLDNWEQVLEAAPLLGRLLDSCLHLTVLATSRIPLRLSREHEYAVPPLAVPDPRNLPDLATVCQYDAVALFIQRARAARAGFEVTSENAPAVAEICTRLDGLPLAIELAAARIKLFPPHALLQRLSHRLTLLTGGARDQPTRQQTLRGAIDWSYSMLTGKDQVLFARLAVFASGCSFEAAEAVCNVDGDLDLLEGMTSLVEKSLLRQEGEEEPRFTMLETIREYALERLDRSGEAATTHQEHARYFHKLAQQAAPELVSRRQAQWFITLDLEMGNLRGAVHWMLDQGQLREAVETVVTCRWFYFVRGQLREPLGWLEKALQSSEVLPPTVRAWALLGTGTFKLWLSNPSAARDDIETSLDLFRQMDDHRGLAICLTQAGAITMYDGRFDDATRYLAEALPRAREAGDRWTAGEARYYLGFVTSKQGRFAEARRWYEESLQIAREMGDKFAAALLLVGLGEVARLEGKLDEARDRFDESLETSREIHAPMGIGRALCERSIVHAEMGAYQQAADGYREGLRILDEAGDKYQILWYMRHVAEFALATGDLQRAACLFGAVAALREQYELLLAGVERLALERRMTETRERMTPEEWDHSWTQGQLMEFDDAVTYALETLDRYPATPEERHEAG